MSHPLLQWVGHLAEVKPLLIDLTSDEFYQIHALSSMHPPPSRPGHQPKLPFRPQSQQSGPQDFFKWYDGPIYLQPQIY